MAFSLSCMHQYRSRVRISAGSNLLECMSDIVYEASSTGLNILHKLKYEPTSYSKMRVDLQHKYV